MPSTRHQYGNLISEVKNNLRTHLKESIAEMFIKMDDALFEMANSAVTTKDQNTYFELMRDTRALKNDISSDFIDAISLYLRPFTETAAEKRKAKQSNEGELSLVGQDEIEDMIMVKSMGGSLAGRFREPLSHLEARLEHLALQTPDIFYKKALQPVNTLQAFDDALGDAFDLNNKKLLFKYFNDHVGLQLGKTYDAINNLLIDADILPQIKLHANKSTAKSPKRSPSHAEQPIAGTDGDEQYTAENDMNQGGYAMTAQPGHGNMGGEAFSPPSGGVSSGGVSSGGVSSGGVSSGGVSSGGASSGGASSGGVSSGGASSGGVSSGGSHQGNEGAHQNEASTGSNQGTSPVGYQHTTAGMPASQVGEVVGQFLGGAPLMPQGATGEGTDNADTATFFPASTGQYYGHQEILNALTNVQHNPIFSNASTAQYDGEAIKQAVLAEIAKSSGGVVTKSINRIAEKTIDFIELVFDAIIDDENISDTVKTLLLRLQIPVIKASMIDQEFFIYDDHPARVLLDKIAHIGIGVTDHKDETYPHLDKIVTNLVNEFELKADSFQIALDHLNTFLDKRDADALKKEEEAQRQILREHARNTVLKSLRSATRGKILPESLHALILKRWPTMMFNHYLKQGKENDEWIDIIDTLRSIINSVQPLSNINDLEHLLTHRDQLIETTRNYLQRTNQSKDDLEQVIQYLIGIHQSLIDLADFDNGDVAIENESALISNNVDKQEIEEEEEETKLQLPSSIVPGMWFQVYLGENKAARRCKLSVVILDEQKLVFVNYQGEVIIEKTLGEFLDEIAEEKSKVIMGHSIFDHALSSVVNNLQKPH